MLTVFFRESISPVTFTLRQNYSFVCFREKCFDFFFLFVVVVGTPVVFLKYVLYGFFSDGTKKTKKTKKKKKMKLKVKHGKDKIEVEVPDTMSIGEFKKAVEEKTTIPVANQKLLYLGKQLSNNESSLVGLGVKDKGVIMVTGCTSEEAKAAAVKPIITTTSNILTGEVTTIKPLCEETQHAKVLESGPPETDTPGDLSAGNRPLPIETETRVPYVKDVVNGAKQKLRLRILSKEDKIVMASESDMKNLPFHSISKITSEPIKSQPQYHIVVLHLRDSANSKLFLYWFPAQYVQNLKNIIFGF